MTSIKEALEAIAAYEDASAFHYGGRVMTTAAKHTAMPWTTNGSIVRTVDGNNMTVRKIATVHGGFGEAEKIAIAKAEGGAA